MLSFTRLVLWWLRSASSLSSRCCAFRSTCSTHASSRGTRLSSPLAIETSSRKSPVFVVRFTSLTAMRRASTLCTGLALAMKARRLTRVMPW